MKFTLNSIFLVAGITVLTCGGLTYAGFTEINTAGDIIQKQDNSGLRPSYSDISVNVPVPLRSNSMWDRISEVTKYNAIKLTENVPETPAAKEAQVANYKALESGVQINAQALASTQVRQQALKNTQAELTQALASIKKYQDQNKDLADENLALKTQMSQMNTDVSELKTQVNFLANQMQNLETNVLDIKYQKPKHLLARN